MNNRPLARTAHYFAAAALNVTNGIKVSVATATTPQSYSGAALDGALLTATGGIKYCPRTVTVTTAALVGAYAVGAPNAIVITGMRGGVQITESLALVAANGGETIRGTQAFDMITQIDVPAQVLNTGHFTFGVGDLCAMARGGTVCSWFKPDADGFVRCRFDENGDRDDSLPVKAQVCEDVAPRRILTDQSLTNPTSVGVTIYIAA
jgi:hypothetical protein